jgi:hypothetical protein
MFKALRHRREVEFRYLCFAGSIGASDYRNAHRTQSSDRVYSPIDYVGCEDDDKVDQRRQDAKRNIASLYMISSVATEEQAQLKKTRVIEDLKRQGFEDADEIFDEVFEG